MGSDSHTTTGKVYHIGAVKTFGQNGFTKRELVLETGDRYPQKVPFECMKAMIDECDKLSLGDTVTIDYNTNGKEVNGDKGQRFFVSLVAWRITIDQKAVKKLATKSEPDEDLPF